jgi:hypothetical protein
LVRWNNSSRMLPVTVQVSPAVLVVQARLTVRPVGVED